MKLSNHHLAIIALLLTNIVWGASSPIFKWTLETIPPFTFAFIRFFIAAAILLPFTIHRLKISHRDLISLFVLAVVGFFFHIGLLLVGLDISSSINASMIATAAPIFLIVGSIFFFKEKVKKNVIIGTAISLSGVLIITLRPIIDKGLDGTILGNVLFIISTLAFVVYTLLIKEYTMHLKTTTITFYLFAISTAIFFPFSLAEFPQHDFLKTISTQAFLGITYAVLFTSITGYLLYNFAIQHAKASEAGIFLYMNPFITAFVAVPLLGEKITPIFIIGGIFVLIGILISEKRLPFNFLSSRNKKNPR